MRARTSEGNNPPFHSSLNIEDRRAANRASRDFDSCFTGLTLHRLWLCESCRKVLLHHIIVLLVFTLAWLRRQVYARHGTDSKEGLETHLQNIVAFY